MEDEQQTIPQEATAETVENPTDGDISTTTNILDRADNLRKGLKEENDRTEALLKRQEAVAARMLLAGKAEAGQEAKTPEETNKEEAELKAKEIVSRFRR